MKCEDEKIAKGNAGSEIGWVSNENCSGKICLKGILNSTMVSFITCQSHWSVDASVQFLKIDLI